jgi:probable DNA metabolism protein
MDYIYDGTFYGLLTCVYEHYYFKKSTGLCEEKNYQYSMVNDFKAIETSEVKAKKVYDAFKNKVSKRALEYIYYAWLSNDTEKGSKILSFIEYGFSYKKDITKHFEHKAVYPIGVLYRKVAQEVHSLLGLLRFSDMEGVLVAIYKPDHDVTELLAPHFSDRLRQERFIIFDEGRRKGAVSVMGRWMISNMDGFELVAGTVECEIRLYWKEYFESVAIKERKNLDIQYQKVPVRYRKNIIEFK